LSTATADSDLRWPVGGAPGARLTAIVPSLRVDVLGARAFKVSRAYFAKGVEAGRVSVGGKTAGKATTVASGDVVVAQGLGTFTVVTVDGLTRKGNAKVTLSVTRSASAVPDQPRP